MEMFLLYRVYQGYLEIKVVFNVFHWLTLNYFSSRGMIFTEPAAHKKYEVWKFWKIVISEINKNWMYRNSQFAMLNEDWSGNKGQSFPCYYNTPQI